MKHVVFFLDSMAGHAYDGDLCMREFSNPNVWGLHLVHQSKTRLDAQCIGPTPCTSI